MISFGCVVAYIYDTYPSYPWYTRCACHQFNQDMGLVSLRQNRVEATLKMILENGCGCNHADDIRLPDMFFVC